MKLPIPSDWNETDWLCVKVRWPDSPMYIGLLMGFLTSMSRGRFWDEKTGTVTDAQAIGLRVEALNMPLQLCGGDPITYPPPEILYMYCTNESEAEMGCPCTVDKRAFEIRGNELWVNDSCEGWVKIGSFLVGSGDVDPDNPPIPDPPEGLTSGSACAKALKIADTLLAIIDTGFNAVGVGQGNVDLLFGWYDFADAVRQAFPNINFGDQDLYQLFYFLYVMEPLGYESETEDQDIHDTVACALKDLFTAGPAGITEDQYNSAKDAVFFAARSVYSAGSLNGFGQNIAYIWQLALSSIGAKDAAKLTTNLPDIPAEDCACPSGPTEASSIFFTGGYNEGSSSADLEVFEVLDGGRRVRVQYAANTDNKKLFAFDANLAGAAAGQNVTVRLYHNTPAWSPGAVAITQTDPAPVNEWHNCSFQGQSGAGVTRDNQSDYVEFTSNNSSGVLTTCRIDEAYITPSTVGGQTQRNESVLEIVAVDGVRLTPLGPA